MAATKNQIALIEELQNLGATIENDAHDNPDSGMFSNPIEADKYIKKWIHLKRRFSTKLSAAEFGGVLNS